jgi:hypothetical protein
MAHTQQMAGLCNYRNRVSGGGALKQEFVLKKHTRGVTAIVLSSPERFLPHIRTRRPRAHAAGPDGYRDQRGVLRTLTASRNAHSSADAKRTGAIVIGQSVPRTRAYAAISICRCQLIRLHQV